MASNVQLTPSTAAIFAKLGDGNVSLGLRLAAAMVYEKDFDLSAPTAGFTAKELGMPELSEEVQRQLEYIEKGLRVGYPEWAAKRDLARLDALRVQLVPLVEED